MNGPAAPRRKLRIPTRSIPRPYRRPRDAGLGGNYTQDSGMKHDLLDYIIDNTRQRHHALTVQRGDGTISTRPELDR